MDRDKNGHDGLNGQEWTAEWTMDNGRWTEIMYLSGLIPTSPIRPIYLIRLIRPICRRKQQTRSQIRVPFHPSKQQPYKFSALSPKIFFFGKDFQKTDALVTGFEGLSHFLRFFWGFLFVVMKAKREADAAGTPALHIPSDGDDKEGSYHIGLKVQA